MSRMEKPRLTLLRIAELNVGFFGLQLSFGLVIANSSPIFRTLGASDATLPLLWLAGPVTGLVVQPIVGTLSDRTHSRFGRRTPYLLTGALLATASLLAMPLAPALWVAVALVWLLDIANNLMLEPYRASIADRLAPPERASGFLVQSAFTGLAQTLAHVLPWLLAALIDRQSTDANGIPVIVRVAFASGALLTLTTILYSLVRVREGPLSAEQRAEQERAHPPGRNPLRELGPALCNMPPAMRRLALPMLCQWYAMFAFWQYFTEVVARSRFDGARPDSPAYREAILTAQQLGAGYNFVAFLAALAMIPLARLLHLHSLHALCLALAGLSMIAIPYAPSPHALMIAMIGIGIGWAAMMGNNHGLLAPSLPAQSTGTYMGIFNLFIVIPMLLESTTLPILYSYVLFRDPSRVLVFAGGLLLLAACATLPLADGRTKLFLRRNRNG
ncbi:MFS transporter [Novosphingobium profundi]|uniref:MFS transporter n=1 Tax=Novosphingobium profundi TaxID=1774954 RepID=UPI001BDAFB92|nr:MFS transporter [Novosphingobium profundi]MBT0667123.1 MFS transporter [Novosphingobium profundi]